MDKTFAGKNITIDDWDEKREKLLVSVSSSNQKTHTYLFNILNTSKKTYEPIIKYKTGKKFESEALPLPAISIALSVTRAIIYAFKRLPKDRISSEIIKNDI